MSALATATDHQQAGGATVQRETSHTRILIADDSVVSRHILDATLRGWGYEVTAACDGEQAWRLLDSADPPRLAILDWMMPGMTGPEVCRMVRNRRQEPYTYIILLTSRNQKEDIVEGLDSGADDYLIKPFDQHELKVRLRAGVRILELQHQLLTARETLREQATRDYLTQVWNRSAILDLLRREIARSEREQSALGLIMADIDFFKTINDTLGHLAGDVVLQEAARTMAASLRPYDSIGRYGGEEFLIVLPNCNREQTWKQAERIRLNLNATSVAIETRSISVSASLGCTSADHPVSSTPEEMIRAADQALYQAKRSGRNCTIYLPLPLSAPSRVSPLV
jgi:diguanylate cyclase (GGDEF)-like protein